MEKWCKRQIFNYKSQVTRNCWFALLNKFSSPAVSSLKKNPCMKTDIQCWYACQVSFQLFSRGVFVTGYVKAVALLAEFKPDIRLPRVLSWWAQNVGDVSPTIVFCWADLPYLLPDSLTDDQQQCEQLGAAKAPHVDLLDVDDAFGAGAGFFICCCSSSCTDVWIVVVLNVKFQTLNFKF